MISDVHSILLHAVGLYKEHVKDKHLGPSLYELFINGWQLLTSKKRKKLP